ncbi:MAG: MucR family transcriptional regulator [Magnetococcales bacterium]|nr:MucR family transcriptional regulator [Magnetococcales bacterium]
MSSELVKRAAEIVEAYVSNNEVPADEVPALLNEVYNSLVRMSGGVGDAAQAAIAGGVEEGGGAGSSSHPRVTPAVPVSEAVHKGYVVCLMCGKRCKALKGHLTRSHKIEVDDYRGMFDLPKDFPLVAPNYSARRRQLAIDAGLGDKLREARKRRSAE